MIITPFVLKNLKKIADKTFIEPEPEFIVESTGLSNHLIIIGYGPIGQKIAQKFRKLGLCYIVIEHEIDLVKLGEANGERIFLANAMQKSVLEMLGAKESLAVIVTLDNAPKIRLVCEAITRIDKNINTIVKVRNDSHQNIIEGFGIKHIINVSENMADIIVKEALACSLKHT